MSLTAFPYVGGKSRYCDWIISHFPAHHCYVEPFGGGASVLLNKPRSRVEIYNDVDDDVVQFFRVLRERRDELQEWLQHVPHARTLHEEWARAFYDGERPDDEIERAGRWFYLRYTQYGAKLNGYSGYKNSTKRNPARTFANNVNALDEVAERFRSVQVENRDWSDVVERNDAESTLFYLDPPYVDCQRYYNVDYFAHAELEQTLRDVEGRWVVSYSDLPDAFRTDRYNHAEKTVTYSLEVKEGEERREATERLVMNFDPSDLPELTEANQTTLVEAPQGGAT